MFVFFLIAFRKIIAHNHTANNFLRKFARSNIKFFFLFFEYLFISTQQYGKLFFVLKSETKYMAGLVYTMPFAEMDEWLQTIIFKLYGEHNNENEELLLLSLFKVKISRHCSHCQL